MGNEKRLIDANAFGESVSTDYWEHFTQCHTTDQIDLMEMIEENLAEQQTVDAVEVVRCKDCKKCGVLEHSGKMFCKEPMGCLGCVATKPDNFCSYGERKVDG